ncbi:MAG: hypothetical protein ACO1N0_03540 [Fluviicola sp.]
MKINFLLLFFVCLLAFSCKKKETTTTKDITPPPNTASPNSFTLKKEGVPYTANYVFVSQVDEDALGFETRIVSNEVSNNTYAGFIRRSIQPGTYVLEDGESEDFSLLHAQDENTLFGWEEGSLTVLSNDTVAKVMHCTFEVLLYNDDCDGSCPQITDGEMTLHY